VPGFDFVLFTNYEAQVSALLNREIDIAWNGPLAHVMTHELAPNGAVSLGMRDVDCDFRCVVVARNDAGISSAADLTGKRVVTGASDSPQGHIVPLHWLAEQGIVPAVRSFDVDLGGAGSGSRVSPVGGGGAGRGGSGRVGLGCSGRAPVVLMASPGR